MSIKIKRCKCGCGKMPSMSCKGYHYTCVSSEVREALFEKSKMQRTKSQARQREKAKIKSLTPIQDGNAAERQNDLNEWFKERHKEMTGFCANCNGRTTKGDTKYWKFSICHILEKRNFYSVRVNPLNFIELCHFGNSCHDRMDSKVLEMQNMKCWNEIQSKFEKMFPFIDKSEYRFIPDVLMNSL